MEIDIDKTLLRKRMVYKISRFYYISDQITNFVAVTWLPVIGIFIFIDGINGFGNNPSTQQTFIEILIFTIFEFAGFFFIRSFFNLDKLHKLQGISADTNRDIIRQLIADNEWQIQIDTKQYLSAAIPSDFSSGRRLTVLFENEWIYVNSTTFAGYFGRSSFHFIVDQRVVRLIKIGFEHAVKGVSAK